MSGFLCCLQLLVHDLLRADIMDMQLKNVQPPDAWKGAVASKQKAQQDILLAYNERDQALAKVTLLQPSENALLALIRTCHHLYLSQFRGPFMMLSALAALTKAKCHESQPV